MYKDPASLNTFYSNIPSLRGQQQSSLGATLQGFAGSSFVCKFHNSFPRGTVLVIRHHNSPLNWSKLGKGLAKDVTVGITWNKMIVSKQW